MTCLLSQSSINLMFWTTPSCPRSESFLETSGFSFSTILFCHLALYLFSLSCACGIMAISLFCIPYVPKHSHPFHYIQNRSFTQLVWITPDCRMQRRNGPARRTECANSSRTSLTNPTASKSRLPREKSKCKFCQISCKMKGCQMIIHD